MPQNPIVQKHPLGCAIACTAYVLNFDYDSALKLFKNGIRKARNQGFRCVEIVSVLKEFGHEYKYQYIKPKTRKVIYQKNTVVLIKKSKKYPAGHYLCRTQGIWMDPWLNFQQCQDIRRARAGFRKKLPDRPIYVILPIQQ